MGTRKLLLSSLNLGLFLSCTKVDPKIATPAYLQIDNYSTITDTVGGIFGEGQGTSIQKFTDVLLSSSTTNYGYYPMPGKMPLPLIGNTYLSIRPVIWVNGVSALRIDYPLMKGFDTTLSLTGGQVIKFKPVFKYYSTVNFRFMENFNGASSGIQNSNLVDTFCVKEVMTSPTQGYLCLRLDPTHTVCQAQSINAFPLPYDGTNVYIEINYKCNTNFEVGIIGTNNPGTYTDQRSAGGANASASWNKLYISLSDLLRTPPTYNYYYLYFYKGAYDTNTGINQICIDNIKVISQI